MKYSCIALYKHTFDDPRKVSQYEERVTMVEASSEKIAERLFLLDIKDYAIDGVTFLGEYSIFEQYPTDGRVLEVASKSRVFAGSDAEYIEKLWSDLRPERCEQNGWEHATYKIQDGLLGCYNCKAEFVE